MRLPHECFGLLLLLLSADLTAAVRFSLEGRRISPDASPLERRASLVGLNNTGDINYFTNVKVGGQDFQCLIDTGSSDLWVAGSVDGAKDTGHSSGVNYAIGSVKGPIKTAEVEFGVHKINRQAYLEVTPDSNNKAGSGLIGFGPIAGSNIWSEMKPDTAGTTVLDSIFLQDTSTPNYLTVLLGRTQDPTDVFPGDLTVGEVIDNYTDVNNMPKITVTDVPVREQGDQHFQILLDSNGVLGPDNKAIDVTTQVKSTKDSKQLTAIFDTGFSLSQVPKAVADAMYSRFDGAEYVNVSGIGATYIVPCDTEVNLTFVIGGKNYPIHPLDSTLDPALMGKDTIANSKGQPSCIGTFQPITFQRDTFDIILGMSFIRNVYTLINFGDFVANNSTQHGDPYMQLLSTTELSEAHSDFVSVRLDGNDNTGQTTLSPLTTTNSNKSSKPSYFWYIIISVSIAGGLFLLLAAWLLFRKRKHGSKGAYAKLHDPHGGHNMADMHYASGGGNYSDQRPLSGASSRYSTGGQGHGHGAAADYYNHDDNRPYDPHHANSYNNPWDHRV